MPFFGGGKEKKKKAPKRVETQASPTPAACPPSEQSRGPSPEKAGPPPQPQSESKAAIAHPPKELCFAAQLAHGSATKKVKNFTNVRELYHRLAAQFDLTAEHVS